MKIQGNGDGAIGMKKGLLQSERLVGNKGHESTIAASQKQKEYVGEPGKSAVSPAYHVSVSKEGKGLAALHEQRRKTAARLLCRMLQRSRV